ncbi:chorismate mutase [Candidatus Woesearchaeota archaeon CG10_big_fil_rev_8_21_14_0_10_45_16]|nr:MAG: chorismate mutase [Candidatus Woesearchaeota archaeon CG10_big_fil_rev_8_21_14_0_10_45_16]
MKDEIISLREEIDAFDEKIILLIKNRIKVAKEIIDNKKRLNLPHEDLSREKEIVDRLSKKGVPKELVEEIYNRIFKYNKCQK